MTHSNPILFIAEMECAAAFSLSTEVKLKKLDIFYGSQFLKTIVPAVSIFIFNEGCKCE